MSYQELAKTSLAAYGMAVDPGYDPAPHHLVLCEALEAVERGEVKFLMVCMPPQHGKSETASRKFVEWYLGKGRGKRKVAFATYAQDFADHWGKQVRDTLVEGQAYREIFPECCVDKSSASKRRFDLTGKGWYAATSVGGPLTGKGPNLLLIDDPVKNYEEAISEATSEKNWSWYRTVVKTRFPQAIILIQTRWSGLDLAAKILEDMKSGGDQWVIIDMEAINTSEDDPIGRPVAQADPSTWRDEHCLWPKKMGADDARAMRRAVGIKAWQSLFQQNPSSDEGSIYKRAWFRFLPKGCDLHELARTAEMCGQSWDMSFKKTRLGSFVVGLVMAKRGPNFYVLDCYRERTDFVGSKKAVVWKSAQWPEATAKWVEAKANGPAIVSELEDTVPGLIPVEKDISKVAAWQSAAPYAEAGNVFLPDPEDAWWVEDFIEEMVHLEDGCQYDDQGDAFAQGVYKLRDYGSRAIIEYYKIEAAERRLRIEIPS